MAVNPIPEGYQSVIPYMIVDGAAKLLDFLKQAFAAVEGERMTRGDGSVGHAEVRIGDSIVMVSDARAPWKPMAAALYVYVPDTDVTYRRAVEAGSESLMEPANQFYGDRTAGVKDPFGNIWWIGTHVEDVSPQELERRAAVSMK
jgi:uncharacterized glyoxalase superfamily protein PhnB